jgi:acyl dehydratase
VTAHVASLAFEDLKQGDSFTLDPYTVTREALLAFAHAFDPQPFHLDEDVAMASVLGGLATSGWHTTSIVMRMIADALVLKLDAMGSAGIDEMKWLKPVYAGDVLSGSLTLTGLRRSQSQPHLGIVQFSAAVGDQNNEAKAFLRSMVFVRITP